MKRTLIHFTVFCVVLAAMTAEAGRIIPLEEEGWPQFRGPRRDGVSTETGLLQSWPEGGPKELWRFDGLGKGYSSPIVTEHGIFITGDAADKLVIYALDMKGGLRWKCTNGAAWTKSWKGARAACTYSAGRLYHMNGHGRTVCLDPETGEELWAVDVLGRFGGKSIQWGLSECLLVDEEHVYVTPGGPEAFMAALDKGTGRTVWKSPPLTFERTYEFGGKTLDPPRQDTDNAGYASPVLFEIGGRRVIARSAGQHAVLLDAADGTLLWQRPLYARYEVIGAIPVFSNDHIYFAAPDEVGGIMFSLENGPEGLRVKKRWKTEFDNCHASMVAVDGKLYGSGYRKRRDWVALDAATGKELYARGDLAQGTCAYADGRVYALCQDGVVALLAPGENAFEIAGQFRIAEGKRKDVWAHPVIWDGRLYLRDHDTLWCYDIKAR